MIYIKKLMGFEEDVFKKISEEAIKNERSFTGQHRYYLKLGIKKEQEINNKSKK